MAQGANLVRITRETQPTAMLTVHDGCCYVVGSEVEVTPKKDPSIRVSYTVESTETKQVSLACPVDRGVTSGITVHLH